MYLNASAASCLQGKDEVQHYMSYFKSHLQASNPVETNNELLLAQEILSGRTADVKEVMSKGVLNPNTTFYLGSDKKMSLLGLALVGCQSDIAKALVNEGADVNGSPDFRPLAIAAGNGNSIMATFLLQHGALIDAVDSLGRTPLEVAVRQRQLSTVKLLISQDPQLNRKLVGGHTLLDLVAPSEDPGDLAIANELRAHGVKSGNQANTN
ncbi:hypothetical protein GCM10010872_20910 [Dyella flava]|nr:hypothetical protein GCM10010872_20910 [Dyella flava]